jgi:hypothetical protein
VAYSPLPASSFPQFVIAFQNFFRKTYAVRTTTTAIVPVTSLIGIGILTLLFNDCSKDVDCSAAQSFRKSPSIADQEGHSDCRPRNDKDRIFRVPRDVRLKKERAAYFTVFAAITAPTKLAPK